MSKWISLEDRQPGHYQPVLLFNPDSREVFTSVWCKSEAYKRDTIDSGYTHWVEAPYFPWEEWEEQ